MNLIQAIINFFKKLFGGTASQSDALPEARSSAGNISRGRSDDDDDDDDDDDSSSTRNAAANAKEEWENTQRFIAQCESSGIDLAGIRVDDPAEYWFRHRMIEQSQADGQTKDQAAKSYGFKDAEHYDKVSSYIHAKWSRLGTNNNGEPDVVILDQFMDAIHGADSRIRKAKTDEKLKKNPQLLEPVNGVTVEQWASASAALANLGAGGTAEQAAEVLRKFNLDKPAFEAASAGWQAKMQADTDFIIAEVFGAAFTKTQADAAGADPGAEPCTFERYVEILVAQNAFAEQGFDISAKLKEVFGINVADFSRYGSYWSKKMQEMAYHRKFTELEAKFKQKYSGASQDDDLSL